MMEHRASKSVKGQSQEEMTMRIEVEAAATSTVHMDSEIGHIHMKEEPCLVQSVKKEPALLVKEEILNNSIQDDNELPCVQGTLTPASTGSVNRTRITSLADLFNVKHELEEMDIGPTILQHMDINYTINKQNMCAVTEENTIVETCNEAMPGTKIKKESIEDNLKDNKTTSCNYCEQTKTEQDYEEVRQKDLNQNALCQHRATIHKPHLRFLHKKQHQLNFMTTSSKTSTTTSSSSPYQCDICEARFAYRGSLTSHMRNHSGEKAYQCDTCHMRFSQSSNLTVHMRVHTGEKPYQCDICDARFGHNVSLTSHMRIHTGEKPYQCDTCDARFTHNASLTSHMRIHTGEKPYKCDTCQMRFAQRSTLTVHMRVHTGEKPYQCDTCDARFSRSNALTSHMKVHTGEKPYQCDTCDARFARRHTLTTHMKVHTGEKLNV